MRIKKVIERKLDFSIDSQLTFSFLGMFILIVAISSFINFIFIGNILKNNYESNSIQQFKQYDYNINTFGDGVDLTSRQLVFDAYLQEITTSYANLQENERVSLAAEAFHSFSQVLGDFNYIDSIIYYSTNGLVLRCTPSKNEIIFDQNAEKDIFSSKELERIISMSKSKLIWLGGYSADDFNIVMDKNTEKNLKKAYYLSAARAIYSGSQSGVLVININMDYFTSIYNFSGDEENYISYIIDSSGTILSHWDNSQIGLKSRVFRKIDENNVTQSYTITDGNVKKQVVYYKLGIPGWLLVNEVPVKTIEKDIIVLRNIIMIIFLAGILFAAFLSRYWIYKITNPLKKLTAMMKKVEYGSFDQKLEVTSKNEIGILLNQFNKMSAGIKELINNNYLIQEEKSQIEMKALRSQINPHFIYNTINTIKWMAIINKADNIAESLTTLSDFLQPIFKNNNTVCTLKEEIDYIGNYVKIMNLRYAGGFKIEFNISEEILQCALLTFMLQPLVENAISHGLMNQNGGLIRISTWTEESSLIISVADNGVGIDINKLNKIKKHLEKGTILQENGNEGIGLTNVNRRIKLHFGDEYGLIINSKQDIGTEVIIKIPLVRKS